LSDQKRGLGVAKRSAGDEELNKNQAEEFDRILLDSIDQSLLTMGESARNSIYFHLEQKFIITKKDIPIKVDSFSDALERIFGLGARYLEILIMKNLHERISHLDKKNNVQWLVSDLTFAKYIETAKRTFCEETGKIEELEIVVDAGEEQEQRVQHRH
jgi:hypothetical protein